MFCQNIWKYSTNQPCDPVPRLHQIAFSISRVDSLVVRGRDNAAPTVLGWSGAHRHVPIVRSRVRMEAETAIQRIERLFRIRENGRAVACVRRMIFGRRGTRRSQAAVRGVLMFRITSHIVIRSAVLARGRHRSDSLCAQRHRSTVFTIHSR